MAKPAPMAESAGIHTAPPFAKAQRRSISVSLAPQSTTRYYNCTTGVSTKAESQNSFSASSREEATRLPRRALPAGPPASWRLQLPLAEGGSFALQLASGQTLSAAPSPRKKKKKQCCVRRAICSKAAQGCGGGMRHGWGRSSTGCGHEGREERTWHHLSTRLMPPRSRLLHCTWAVACTEAPAAPKEHSTGQEERAGHPQSVSGV